MERSVENSAVVTVLRMGFDRTKASIDTSRTVRAMSAVSPPFKDAVATSRTDRYLSTLLTWFQHAFLVRWLTRADDDRNIVIDPTDAFVIRALVALSERNRLTDESQTRTSDGRSNAGIVSFISRAPIRAVSIAVASAVIANGIVLVVGGGPTIRELSIRGVVLTIAVAGIRVDTSWETLSQARTIQLLETLDETMNPSDSD